MMWKPSRRKEADRMQEIDFTVHMFKEGDTYVTYVPELDVSSCGVTDEEARKNIRDAVRGFVETSRDLGTLADILTEAGYVLEGDSWRAPEFVSLDRFTTSLK
jgi:predicted RNase H-like HicB family nuclease